MVKPFSVAWTARGRQVTGDGRPKVMGIVNVTPDSFSDGGLWFDPEMAAGHARMLIREGADLLDVGGESSRPGASPVNLDEELRRVLPVIEILAAETMLPISVDTTKADVARLAIDAGAAIINDITAFGRDRKMVRIAAESGAGVVLMHMQGTPSTMQDHPHYDDVLTEVYDFLAFRLEWAVAQGLTRSQIAIDPGIGFGKTNTHSLELLRNLSRFANLGCAILIGTSRKGLLGKLTGRETKDRAVASAVSALAAVALGASIVRVHDVAQTADSLRIWDAQVGWDRPSSW